MDREPSPYRPFHQGVDDVCLFSFSQLEEGGGHEQGGRQPQSPFAPLVPQRRGWFHFYRLNDSATEKDFLDIVMVKTLFRSAKL